SEVRIYAAPFCFNKNPSTNPMTYNWSVNNVEQPDLLKNQTIILKPKGDASGSSLINLEVRNVEEILQAARLSLLVSFKKK
ncbi:MAG: hypothetical protein WCL06_16560, partial [Bacteroidota bacterium]